MKSRLSLADLVRRKKRKDLEARVAAESCKAPAAVAGPAAPAPAAAAAAAGDAAGNPSIVTEAVTVSHLWPEVGDLALATHWAARSAAITEAAMAGKAGRTLRDQQPCTDACSSSSSSTRHCDSSRGQLVVSSRTHRHLVLACWPSLWGAVIALDPSTAMPLHDLQMSDIPRAPWNYSNTADVQEEQLLDSHGLQAAFSSVEPTALRDRLNALAVAAAPSPDGQTGTGLQAFLWSALPLLSEALQADVVMTWKGDQLPASSTFRAVLAQTARSLVLLAQILWKIYCLLLHGYIRHAGDSTAKHSPLQHQQHRSATTAMQQHQQQLHGNPCQLHGNPCQCGSSSCRTGVVQTQTATAASRGPTTSGATSSAAHTGALKPPVPHQHIGAFSSAVLMQEEVGLQAMWSAICASEAAGRVPGVSSTPACKPCYGHSGILLKGKPAEGPNLTTTVPAETLLKLVTALRPGVAALMVLTAACAGPLANQPIQADLRPWTNPSKCTSSASIQPHQLLCRSGLQLVIDSIHCPILRQQWQQLTDVAVFAVPSSLGYQVGGLAGWLWATHALLKTALSSPAVLTAGSKTGVVNRLTVLVNSLVTLSDAITLALRLLQQPVAAPVFFAAGQGSLQPGQADADGSKKNSTRDTVDAVLYVGATKATATDQHIMPVAAQRWLLSDNAAPTNCGSMPPNLAFGTAAAAAAAAKLQQPSSAPAARVLRFAGQQQVPDAGRDQQWGQQTVWQQQLQVGAGRAPRGPFGGMLGRSAGAREAGAAAAAATQQAGPIMQLSQQWMTMGVARGHVPALGVRSAAMSYLPTWMPQQVHFDPHMQRFTFAEPPGGNRLPARQQQGCGMGYAARGSSVGPPSAAAAAAVVAARQAPWLPPWKASRAGAAAATTTSALQLRRQVPGPPLAAAAASRRGLELPVPPAVAAAATDLKPVQGALSGAVPALNRPHAGLPAQHSGHHPLMVKIEVAEPSAAQVEAARQQMATACQLARSAAAAAAGRPQYNKRAERYATWIIAAPAETVQDLVLLCYPACGELLLLPNEQSAAPNMPQPVIRRDAVALSSLDGLQPGDQLALHEGLLQVESGLKAACSSLQPAPLSKQMQAALTETMLDGGALATWFWKALDIFTTEMTLQAFINPKHGISKDPGDSLEATVNNRVRVAKLLVITFNHLVRCYQQGPAARQPVLPGAAGGGGLQQEVSQRHAASGSAAIKQEPLERRAQSHAAAPTAAAAAGAAAVRVKKEPLELQARPHKAAAAGAPAAVHVQQNTVGQPALQDQLRAAAAFLVKQEPGLPPPTRTRIPKH